MFYLVKIILSSFNSIFWFEFHTTQKFLLLLFIYSILFIIHYLRQARFWHFTKFLSMEYCSVMYIYNVVFFSISEGSKVGKKLSNKKMADNKK